MGLLAYAQRWGVSGYLRDAKAYLSFTLEPWRLRRQAFHEALPPSTTARWEPDMMQNTLDMLSEIIEKPQDTFVQFFEYLNNHLNAVL